MLTPIAVSAGPVNTACVPLIEPVYIALSIIGGGGQVIGVQALRGLVQNTEPQVVGSVADVMMRLVPPSDSTPTRAPTIASISNTTSPHAKRYLLPFLVGVTGPAAPPPVPPPLPPRPPLAPALPPVPPRPAAAPPDAPAAPIAPAEPPAPPLEPP